MNIDFVNGHHLLSLKIQKISKDSIIWWKLKKTQNSPRHKHKDLYLDYFAKVISAHFEIQIFLSKIILCIIKIFEIYFEDFQKGETIEIFLKISISFLRISLMS